MKIRYTKKRLQRFLIFGILWLVLAAAAIVFNLGSVFIYGYLILGIVFLAAYAFENSRQYLSIENGIISKNQLISKAINLNEIVQVSKFAGNYTVKSNSAELKINTAFIEQHSLAELKKVLGSLNLEAK